MKIARGIEQAKRILSVDRGINLDSVPAHVQATTERVFGEPLTPQQTVERILASVKAEGDSAIRRLANAIEGVELDEFEVTRAEIKSSYDDVDRAVIEALELSAERVEKYHRASKPESWMNFDEGYGGLVVPCERVGAYIPGGTAPLPSTVLMSAIPAKVAGVSEVLVCTPPAKTGKPEAVTLVASDIAGVDRVFGVGGAQAIGAIAYGTETIPAVDIICGPGNIFVTLAKKQVYGEVGIDGLYGPTETLILADESANPTLCAADLLAQAEHDVLARPVMVTTSEALADQVEREAETRLARLTRESVARPAMENRAVIAIVGSLTEALELANWFAPEHMCLMVADPWSWVGRVRNAGIVFIGEFSHEVLGDYVAGPSHVMPTGGTARFNSGLGIHSFVKIMPVVALSDEVSNELATGAAAIARAEGLTAHAEAAEIREEMLGDPQDRE
ncbi:MAG: histidinol dehydrogenase [SAR202 cluster bacterium]|nr:histidinol dehydrogenase [SAR202 cluster bacterium]MDP6716087.1 histidinol dehydrogenase [SAR202 cluster bacterium]